MIDYNVRASQRDMNGLSLAEYLQNTCKVPPFCSECCESHPPNQYWESPKTMNFREHTNYSQWSPYSDTYDYEFQSRQSFDQFQYDEPQHSDFQNYCEVPPQASTSPKPDLESILAEFMEATQASIRITEIQMEELILDLKSQPLQYVPDDMENVCSRENPYEACNESNHVTLETRVDENEKDNSKTLEHAIEPNIEDGVVCKDDEELEMDEKEPHHIQIDVFIDVATVALEACKGFIRK